MTSASGDERAVIVEALARLLLDDLELEDRRSSIGAGLRTEQLEAVTPEAAW